MATPAQIAANQANAQKSTGPTTEAGKATCSRNATRHGLCRAITCLDDDDPDEAQTLLAELMAEHQPQTPTEEILVYKMAEQFYLTRRAGHYLTIHTMYNEESRKGDARQVALYLRYYTSADRAFNRNLHDLRKLQKERELARKEPEIGFVSEIAPLAPVAAPKPPEIAPQDAETAPAEPRIGLKPALIDLPHRLAPRKEAA